MSSHAAEMVWQQWLPIKMGSWYANSMRNGAAEWSELMGQSGLQRSCCITAARSLIPGSHVC